MCIRDSRARSWFPVIVFSFSRRQCEEHAKALTKGKTQLDFTTTEQKEVIKQIYDNALLCMAEEDRDLECVREIYPFLERGIGIHHGGPHVPPSGCTRPAAAFASRLRRTFQSR